MKENGLPDTGDLIVKREEDVVQKFAKFEKASVIMVVMAQLMSANIPPMRICSFGSKNCFTTVDLID